MIHTLTSLVRNEFFLQRSSTDFLTDVQYKNFQRQFYGRQSRPEQPSSALAFLPTDPSFPSAAPYPPSSKAGTRQSEAPHIQIHIHIQKDRRQTSLRKICPLPLPMAAPFINPMIAQGGGRSPNNRSLSVFLRKRGEINSAQLRQQQMVTSGGFFSLRKILLRLKRGLILCKCISLYIRSCGLLWL